MACTSPCFVQLLTLQQTSWMRPCHRQLNRFAERRMNARYHQVSSPPIASPMLPKWRPTMSEAETKHIADSSPNILSHSTHLLRSVWQAAIHTSGRNIAIDATAGRGSDTLTLCKLLSSHDGTVHTFDIQSSALAETRARYQAMKDAQEDETSIAQLQIHHACHSEIESRTGADAASVACVTYNLGWYPGKQADRSVITRPHTSVQSLESASRLIAPGGVISVMAYVGHPGGADEEEAIRLWCSKLNSRLWTVAHLTYPNRKQAPVLLLCQRSLAV